MAVVADMQRIIRVNATLYSLVGHDSMTHCFLPWNLVIRAPNERHPI